MQLEYMQLAYTRRDYIEPEELTNLALASVRVPAIMRRISQLRKILNP